MSNDGLVPAPCVADKRIAADLWDVYARAQVRSIVYPHEVIALIERCTLAEVRVRELEAERRAIGAEMAENIEVEAIRGRVNSEVAEMSNKCEVCGDEVEFLPDSDVSKCRHKIRLTPGPNGPQARWPLTVCGSSLVSQQTTMSDELVIAEDLQLDYRTLCEGPVPSDTWEWDKQRHIQMGQFAKKLIERTSRAESWKREQLAVEASWNARAVGKELGIALGDSIRANILPKVKELKERLSRAEAEVERLKSKLADYAVTMSYDCPGDAPIECGLWCDLCKEHIDKGSGHKPNCFLAALSAQSRRPCPECGQIPSKNGVGGEYPCKTCGLPTTHDPAQDRAEANLSTLNTAALKVNAAFRAYIADKEGVELDDPRVHEIAAKWIEKQDRDNKTPKGEL